MGFKGDIVLPGLIKDVSEVPAVSRGRNTMAAIRMMLVLLSIALLALSSAQWIDDGKMGKW
jgi:hypothetical protein